MNIRTLLIDDEALARVRMRELLAEHSDIEIVEEFSSGIAFKASLPKTNPDLVFLDVQMPRITGLKIAQTLGDSPLPLVIFVTAHDSFALEAFDTRAVDYLLKPVSPQRLARALTRTRDQLAAIRAPLAATQPSSTDQEPRRSLSRLMAKSGDRVFFIHTTEIHWIESAGNYVVVSTGKERHIIRETMATLEAELSPNDFVRLNRSLIVSIKNIVELQSQGQGEYSARLTDGKLASVTVGLRELERRLRFP